MFNNKKKLLYFTFVKLFFICLISNISASDLRIKYNSKTFINFAGVKYHLIQNGISPNRYIWIHGDEKTAEMALKHHIQNHNGIAFFIDNKTREIPYKSTIIDPNRIFSRNGTYHALRKFQPGWAPGSLKKALDEIDLEREAFLNILMPPKDGLLIALHNNFRGYNVMDEEANSQLTSIKKSQNLRDFIICTDLKDFKKLAKGPFNVVLQNKTTISDDGSLSWEALRRGIRYLNVETRLGYLTQQKKMLKFIEEELN